PVRAELRHPVRDAGAQVPVPGELRPGSLALRAPARLALRGDGLCRLLQRRAGPVGAGVLAGRRRSPQRHGHDHSVDHPHGPTTNPAKRVSVLALAPMMTKPGETATLPHSEERLAELMLYTELTRACMRAAEADAKLDEWGVMCPAELPAESTRNLFMTAYPRMVEILQLLGSSSFMITPTEADFSGALAPQIEQYLATDTASARDRVKLFRLAWDVAGSAFGSRQVLYERFFASDPLTRARALGAIYPKDEMMDRVRRLLNDE